MLNHNYNGIIKQTDDFSTLTFRKLAYTLPISVSDQGKNYHQLHNLTPTRARSDRREGKHARPCAKSEPVGGVSNTPIESQANHPQSLIQLHFDWICGFTAPLQKNDQELFEEILDSVFPQPRKSEEQNLTLGSHKFTHRSINAYGFQCRYYNSPKGRINYFICPGSLLSQITVPQQLVFLAQLVYGVGFRPTRLDLSLDDFSRTAPIAKIYQALEKKAFSGCRTVETASSFDKKFWSEYKTVYLGKGAKRLRIYDCLPVHNTDCIRFEAQLREHYAQSLLDQLLPGAGLTHKGFYQKGFVHKTLWNSDKDLIRDEQQICQHLANLVLGSYDFYSQKKSKNLNRNKLATWWSKLKKLCNVARYQWQFPKKESNLSRSAEWLRRQVSKTLTIFKFGLSDGCYQAFIESLNKIGGQVILNKDDFYLVESLLNMPSEELNLVLKLGDTSPLPT